MKNKEQVKGTMNLREKKIRKYGYEYTLIETDRDHYKNPLAFGIPGYVLKSFKKLDGSK